MIWTLALMLWQLTAPPIPHQPQFSPVQRRGAFSLIVTPYGKTTIVPRNGFVQGQSPMGKCSIPLVNAPGVDIKTSTRSMPMVHSREIDPMMNVAAPAPPCKNWFGK